MSERDTIAAVATPRGAGGVAIVRISGSEAFTIAAAVLRRSVGRGLPSSRRVYIGMVVDPEDGEALDQVLAFGMRGPRSFTGEDTVEIQCHGGMLLTERILECVCRAGARVADPGEFTKRAFLNGRMDLAQAEAVADLIAARSRTGIRLAWSQLDGTLSKRVSTLRSEILTARALCEVALDFPDEDIPESLPEDVRTKVVAVRLELESLAATFDRGRVGYAGARVSLIGRPNVGKSSILNALVGRERALVSPIPGTTRDVVEATVLVQGSPIVVMDTAGIRETVDVVEAMGMERSRSVVAEAVCTLAVFDGSEPLGTDDVLVKDALGDAPAIAVVNKADLPTQVSDDELERLLGKIPIVRICALHGRGIERLIEAMAAAIFRMPIDQRDDEGVIYRVRHYDAARRAMDDVARAERALTEDAPLELVAADLMAAATSLATITGEISNEDVLDEVFAEFCIGK